MKLTDAELREQLERSTLPHKHSPFPYSNYDNCAPCGAKTRFGNLARPLAEKVLRLRFLVALAAGCDCIADQHPSLWNGLQEALRDG